MIQGLEEYTYEEVLNEIDEYVQNIIEEYELGIIFIDSALHGSRLRGTAKESSDLDYVFEYDGNMKEDAVFNIMHEDPFYIEGIEVDINPIRKYDSGDLQKYMKKSNDYDKEILNSMNESKSYNVLNESKNLQLALDLLDDDQIQQFKEWIIVNDCDEQQQLSYILKLMNNSQLGTYKNNIMSDTQYIDNQEEISKNYIEDQQTKKYMETPIINDLVLWMENTEHLTRMEDAICASLIKKENKGIELNINTLANSAVLDNLLRQTIKDYEHDLKIKTHLNPIIRKLIKAEFAKAIFIKLQDYR